MTLETNTHRLTEIIAKYPFPHTIWYHMVNQKEWRFKKKSKRWGDELIYYTLYVPVISKFCVIAFTLAVIVFAWTFWGILSRFIHASPVLITLPDANLKLVFYAFKIFQWKRTGRSKTHLGLICRDIWSWTSLVT